MLRNLFLALGVAVVLSTSAFAGVIGTATLVANPPAVNFLTDTGYNSAPLSDQWVSYILGLQTDDGSNIASVDITLTGVFNQRWTINDEGTAPTPSSNNKTNADTHLILPTSPVTAVAPNENNNQVGSFPPIAPDTDTRDYGIGTLLNGSWGYATADRATQVEFAYVVIPKGKEKELLFNVKAATNPAQEPALVLLDSCQDFFAASVCGGTVDVIPTVADLLHNTTTLGEVVNLTPTDTAPGTPPVTFSALTGPTYTPGFGAPNNAPGLGTATFSWNPATQAFQFNTLGATRGTYVWTGTASNTAGSDPFSLTVNVTQVPEPATFAMVGLALVGFVGVARRRS
jgi:hypothetical protein